MLKLVDVLSISESEYKNYKVHLATVGTDGINPYNKFLLGEFKEWQEYQTQKNFSRKYIISLINYAKNKWLFGGVYEVLPVSPTLILREESNLFKYQTKLVDCQTDLIGRAFIHYEKYYRASYPTLELIPNDKISMSPRDAYIVSMVDKRISINDFNGFDEVNIDYQTLKAIVSDNITSWKSALSNVKGIYLIADKLTGKQYVGSAYGEECIWQRWFEYAKNGHGGNKELKELLLNNGEDYKYNFKYSILEVCNMNLGNEYIISRESYWKEVLQTRKFGLNKN